MASLSPARASVGNGGSPRPFTTPVIDRRPLPTLRRNLLAWFDRSHRPLPWRANRDPYRIWVSEVMLQQTTVAAVVPYYERFLTVFPTVVDLAEADEQHVLRLWQGLGYYRRARHLHAAARRLVTEHGNTLPDDPGVWAELPGVGRYILGAVLSQAFDRRLPIVEANSLRVLSRWFASRLDPREGEGKKWVWAAAEAVLPRKRVGDFNQAVMELGALICTPDNPKCGDCPVRNQCAARRLGLQAVIPPKAARKETVAVREVAVVLRDGNRLLLCRRPPDAGRWANMWELPRDVVRDGESEPDAAVRVAAERLGLGVAAGVETVAVRHGVTRFDITVSAVEADRAPNQKVRLAYYTAWRWADRQSASDYPMSTSMRKLCDELTNPGRQKRLF
jgi:A/G-specific adenine glycosylase